MSKFKPDKVKIAERFSDLPVYKAVCQERFCTFEISGQNVDSWPTSAAIVEHVKQNNHEILCTRLDRYTIRLVECEA